MKLSSKILATGILFLSAMAFASSPAEAAWFGKKYDSQACKAKFEDKCQASELAKTVCEAEFIDFYCSIDKLKSDLQALRDSQAASEKIFSQLQSSYEAWKRDGFRINTQTYTDYAISKIKFADQNREVAEKESLVTSEMKDMVKFISSKKSKQSYVSILDSTLEAFYDYSAAVAREAIPTVK